MDAVSRAKLLAPGVQLSDVSVELLLRDDLYFLVRQANARQVFHVAHEFARAPVVGEDIHPAILGLDGLYGPRAHDAVTGKVHGSVRAGPARTIAPAAAGAPVYHASLQAHLGNGSRRPLLTADCGLLTAFRFPPSAYCFLPSRRLAEQGPRGLRSSVTQEGITRLL